jgi:N utilization substance protein B
MFNNFTGELMMSRKASRELAMKLLYQYEFQNENKQELLSSTINLEELNDNDRDYIQNIFQGVLSEAESIDSIIDENAKGWKLSRMSKVDIAILRLAVYELKFSEDVPCNVAINEAIELAKKYSAKESGAFINGILGKVAKLCLINKPNLEKK